MQLYYREKGLSSLPPLVILHGLWGASENWLKIADILSACFHVVIPDLPNHGQSGHTPQHNYPHLAACVQDFIRQQDFPQPPAIVGHSMGGKTLMYLLLKWPEIASKAIIIDIAPKDYGQASATGQHERILAYLNSNPIGEIRERTTILSHIRANFPEEELYQLLAKNVRRNNESGLFEWKVNSKAIQDGMENLLGWEKPIGTTTTSTPILFIKGENSDYIDPAKDLSLIRQLFPAASLAEIPETGHAIHATQPEQLSTEILRFLRKDWQSPYSQIKGLDT